MRGSAPRARRAAQSLPRRELERESVACPWPRVTAKPPGEQAGRLGSHSPSPSATQAASGADGARLVARESPEEARARIGQPLVPRLEDMAHEKGPGKGKAGDDVVQGHVPYGWLAQEYRQYEHLVLPWLACPPRNGAP